MYEFSVKAFCKLLLGSLAHAEDFAFEVEGLSCHLVIHVHLDHLLAHFKNDARNHSSHAVEHRDGRARNEKVLADFSVYLECSLRKVDDPARVHFAVSVCRSKSDVKCRACFHAFDMFLELRKEAVCSMYVVKRSLLCCLVDDLSVNL